MRNTIERAFRAPVRDVYSAWEVATIAHECPNGGTYHVCDDNVIVELPEGTGKGEPSTIIVTALHFAAMPIIRYELGDLVTRGPARCACGSPFTTLRSIQGRIIDFFDLPSGRRLYPYEISSLIDEMVFRCVRWYSFEQERTDRIVARLVLRSSVQAEEVASSLEEVRSFLGPSVELEIQYLDDVPIQTDRKFGVFRSLLKP
jgi:phenylacetate-CoA ligase